MPQSTVRILIRFLGSMNLAITLLVAIAIAAVIGTVVQQNQPYADYVLKFGPFWFEVFQRLDLFNVYSAPWFLAILGFLVLSTSVCVYRHLPLIIADLRDYRDDYQRAALLRLEHHRVLDGFPDVPITQVGLESVLRQHQYRYILKERDGAILLAAKKGDAGRWGYLFSHLAIIVICIGGLLDGNLPLKIAEWRGTLAVENRRIPASEIPEKSTLGVDNLSFRANVDIAEGGQADLAFIDYKDGYLLQKLPFAIQVDDFRIEHYPSGQPKSFASDLTIIDPILSQPFKQTIEVNHPLNYRGYSIYQNSFGDGGSKLNLNVWSLQQQQASFAIQAEVKQHAVLSQYTLELSDFRPFNVLPDPSGNKQFVNIGPSFQFKLRDATGVANEYLSYMLPNQQDGRWFFVSGMRRKLSEPFLYWFIPADNQQSLQRFMRFYQSLHDEQKLRHIANVAAHSSKSVQEGDAKQRQIVIDFMVKLGGQFAEGGYEKIASELERSLPESQRQTVADLYATVLQQLLKELYLDVLQQEGVNTDPALSDFDAQFFTDAVEAANLGYQYGVPWFLELKSFKHIEATGLQITRSPGQWLVFPGCVLLVLGVFCMFYLPQRRLWVWLEPGVTGTSVLLSGQAIRNRYDFDREFEALVARINTIRL